jgi:2-C-methyl-D-erythritol 4-phosphate cytidylyltransferase
VTTLDSQRGDVAVVLAAGGAGRRLGGGMPKALRRLAGEPLLVHAVRRVIAASSVGWVVVAAPPGYEPAVRELLGTTVGASRSAGGWAGQVVVVAGGAHRQESVAAALGAVPDEFTIVLVHDAARALAPGSLVEAVATAVRAGRDAVVPVLPVTDTISQVDLGGRVVGSPDRSGLRAVQTPQGFRHAVLAAAHAADPGSPDPAAPVVTDDAGLVARLGVPVHTVPGSASAMKITTSHDLVVAEALLAAGRPGAP